MTRRHNDNPAGNMFKDSQNLLVDELLGDFTDSVSIELHFNSDCLALGLLEPQTRAITDTECSD